MRKLEISDADIMRLAVQDEIMRSEESRYDHRLHGILLVCNGFSCSAVAELFGHSRRTVQYWARWFEQSGFAVGGNTATNLVCLEEVVQHNIAVSVVSIESARQFLSEHPIT